MGQCNAWPLSTASEYYSSKARLRWDSVKTQLSETEIDGIKHAKKLCNDINELERAGLIAWLHVQAAPLAVVPELDSGPFLLYHADLTVTNIIVDDNFHCGIPGLDLACAVPQQSFTVFHTPHDSRLDFLWPSNVAEVEARDKKQLIDDVKTV
jgi:hypothetical protein